VSESISWRASALRRSAQWRRQMRFSGAKFCSTRRRSTGANGTPLGGSDPRSGGARGFNSLQLSFGQRIQLKMAALMPQPGVGVGDAAHLDRRGKR